MNEHLSPPAGSHISNFLSPGAVAAIVAGGNVRDCTVIFNPPPSKGDHSVSTVVGHEQYLDLLTGADKYLHPVTAEDRRREAEQEQRIDRLAFIPPAFGGHPARPAKILETLESGAHILITGPAGSGKTRLCIEAAQAAHDAGWHVKHITGAVPFAQLVAEVNESGDRNALFVFGQPEKALGFAPHELVKHIRLKASSAASRTIGILAASPTGALTAQSLGDEQFDLVRAPVDRDHTNAVIDQIIRLAGWPRQFQGDMFEAAMAVCGDRPGLAVRIAPNLALDSKTKKPDGVRRPARKSGTELSRWIGRSLTADGLATGGDTDEPLRIIGAAVALMMSPQTRERVQQAVEAVLKRSAAPSDGAAVLVMDRLLRRGWLVERDGELEPPHAVVADELLARVMLTSDGESLSNAADWIFTAALESPLACRRLVEAVRRLVVDHPHPNLAALLETRCRAWVAANRDLLGELALDYEREFPNEPGLIADMLSERPWHAIALDHLEPLSHRFFSGRESGAAYRARLLRCLNALGADELPDYWSTVALNLVSGAGEEEGELLHAVLMRAGSKPGRFKQFRERALAWLDRHPHAASAAEALGLLLKDRRVSDEEARLDVERGLDWLAHNSGESASHVIAALINSPRPKGRQLEDLWRVLRIWLGRNSRALNAKFVLGAMLRDPQRPGGFYFEALPFTLEWFEANWDDPATWRVAREFCNDRAIGEWWPVMMAWVETHATDPMIIPALARMPLVHSLQGDLDRQRQLIRSALIWLQANPNHVAVPEICKGLVGHGSDPDLKGKERKRRQNLAVTIDQADAIVESITNWFKTFGPEYVRDHVMTAFLGYQHAGKESKIRFAGYAVDWFEHPHTAAESQRVLPKLARRGGLTPELAERIVARADKEIEAFPWIACNQELQTGIFIIFDKHSETTRETLRDKLIDAALGEDRPDRAGTGAGRSERLPSVDSLLRLLDLPGLEPARRAAVVDRAILWIERHSHKDDADKLIRKVLDEPDLDHYRLQVLIDHAFEWLDWWIALERPPAAHEGPSGVFTRLLARPELREEDVDTAFDLANKWRARNGKTKSTAHRRIAEAFLGREELSPETSARCLSIVLYSYRPGDEHQDEARGRALEQAVAWLGDHAELACASQVLGPALRKVQAEHDLEWDRAAVVRAAATWLPRHGTSGPAVHVIKPLLQLDEEERLPPDFPDLLPFALAYMTSQADQWYSATVFPKLCARDGLSQQQRGMIVDTAAAWFEGRSSDRDASGVLYGLARLPLAEEQLELLIEACTSWARNMIEIVGRKYESGMTGYRFLKPWDPRFVLRKVLARTDLSPSQCSRVLGVALRTHWVNGLRNTNFDWGRKPDPGIEIDSDTESEASTTTESGERPLLLRALEHLMAVDNAVEIGPMLAEAQTFKLEPDQRTLIRDRSLTWLEAHAGTPEAGEVCVQLARRMPPPPLDDASVRHSVTWLGAHPDGPAAPALLGFLMSRPLSDDHLQDLLPFAERALTEYAFTVLDSRLLSGVIAQPRVLAESAQRHAQTAIDMLKVEGTVGVAADLLLEGLSKCRHVNLGQRRQVVDLVMQRASQPKASNRTGALIVRCLGMESVDCGDRDRLFGAAVAWADGHIANDTAWSDITELGAFVERAARADKGLGAGQVQRAAKLMVAVSTAAEGNPKAAACFCRVLRFGWIEEPEAGEIRRLALGWLRRYCASSEAAAGVLLALWPLQSNRKGWEDLARLAGIWLEDHDRSPSARRLVSTMCESEAFQTLPTRIKRRLERFEVDRR